MIIKERDSEEFVFIEQHHHAYVSYELIKNLKDSFVKDETYKASLLEAVRLHDCGWRYVDKQPFWNIEENKPYDFTDFPLSAKVMVYEMGINEVEQKDLYAALLCSVHYTKFIMSDSEVDAKIFVEKEKLRQEKIMHQLGRINKHLFEYHYALLQFADSLSLYFCLNDPGVSQDEVHFFFREGIHLPFANTEDKLMPLWDDKGTVHLDPFPFQSSINIELQQKRIHMEDIKRHGLIPCYEANAFETVYITIK
ncbi:DUF3891 family protein [Oceanobacillus piezotolerans]|nr:DUF3891 family protein [Oceanobacillus piezotolerans]